MTDPGQPVHDVRQLLSGTTRHLACGADIDELLEQAADGHAGQLTSHQRHCPHCQAALPEFSRLWEPVRSLAAEHVAVPATLKTAVASQIRKLIADVWYTLQLSDSGAIRIAARVVATIAREAARTVPGVRAAFGRSTHSTTASPAEKQPSGTTTPTPQPASSAAPPWSTSPSPPTTAANSTPSPAKSSSEPSPNYAPKPGSTTSPSTSPSTTSSPRPRLPPWRCTPADLAAGGRFPGWRRS